MVYQHSVGNFQYSFPDLKTVLAKASPEIIQTGTTYLNLPISQLLPW